MNVLASGLALVALVGLVSLAAAVFFSGKDFLMVAVFGNLIALPTALGVWNGALGKGTDCPPSWREWIGVFFGAGALSAAFVAIDVALVHPGFSLVFTIGAVAITFVALPSALRAWLLERGSREHGNLNP